MPRSARHHHHIDHRRGDERRVIAKTRIQDPWNVKRETDRNRRRAAAVTNRNDIQFLRRLRVESSLGLIAPAHGCKTQNVANEIINGCCRPIRLKCDTLHEL